MATVSVRVPDELKARMDQYEQVNWSAVLRRQIEAELADLGTRNVARAVATSERLSREIDAESVEDEDITRVIRGFRDERHSGDSA